MTAAGLIPALPLVRVNGSALVDNDVLFYADTGCVESTHVWGDPAGKERHFRCVFCGGVWHKELDHPIEGGYMNIDREKIRQAVTEWKHAFFVYATPLYFALLEGLKVGDGGDKTTVFPDLSALKALLAAAAAGGVASFLKAAWWYVSGTKV